MHTSRSPSASIQSGPAGDVSDLNLTGSQLMMGRRPSSASAGKHFSRSVSVSVTSEGRGKRNTLADGGLGRSRAMKNLRRSNSTTQVNQQDNTSPSEGHSGDFLTLFNSSSDGQRTGSSLSKASKDHTTWNILDEQPRVFLMAGSSHSADSPTGLKTREPGANFTANNRSNKAAVGNSVTTILHNNHSEKPLTPKSSNQKPSFNNIIKATVNDELSPDVSASLTKSQKNFSSASSSSNNNASHSPRSPAQPRRREVTEEEAERFIQQVSAAAVTIQRWYRRHASLRRANQDSIKHLLSSKKKEMEQKAEEEKTTEVVKRKEDERKRMREDKARLARLKAIQDLQMKRSERAAEVRLLADEELKVMQNTGRTGRKKVAKSSPTSLGDVKAQNTDLKVSVVLDAEDEADLRPAASSPVGSLCSQEILQRSVSMEDQRPAASSSRAQSKTTLNELLDTLKLLEEEPARLSEPKSHRKDKYSWIDEEGDPNSLTTDNVERHRQLSQNPALPNGGLLLSESKLQTIMSFLEKSEQERPRSVTSGSHRELVLSEEDLAVVEQASATAAEVTNSMLKLKVELEEKKRTVNILQTALAQQRELTIRHVKETETELNHTLELQKQQYEATIQRHLTFIDQLIDDKKALSERCEEVVAELKQVDQKYTKKISEVQEQNQLVWQILAPMCEEIKKLKELMRATEKIRREKWIDEKTKRIKEITVKGLEPEIQKLISKHKQELKRLRVLHESEILQADEKAARRFVSQSEELRQQLEREKQEHCQREREMARQRFEKQLEDEENVLQQQRRRLLKELAEEKERVSQLASRQHAELEELKKQMEENSSMALGVLREEMERIREEQERRHQVEMKALKEQMEIEKQAWEENYVKKEEVWLLGREREIRDEARRGRDKEIEMVIRKLEEETRAAREECERVADSRIKRVRDKCESELKELERSERSTQQKHQELRAKHLDAETELLRLQSLLRQREQEISHLTQSHEKLSEERHGLTEVIRQEFAQRMMEMEEENRRMKVEVSEAKARTRLEQERMNREKDEELAEVHHRVKSAILKKDETVSNLRKQREAAVKRADHLESLLEQQRKQLLGK